MPGYPQTGYVTQDSLDLIGLPLPQDGRQGHESPQEAQVPANL